VRLPPSVCDCWGVERHRQHAPVVLAAASAAGGQALATKALASGRQGARGSPFWVSALIHGNRRATGGRAGQQWRQQQGVSKR
jgi:hypothetical protein